MTYRDMKFYGVKRPRPKGLHALKHVDGVDDLRYSSRYRIPHSAKGHYWNPASSLNDPCFYCGLSVWMNPDWCRDSGYEDMYGPYWVVQDTRNDSVCTVCRQWRERKYVAAPPPVEQTWQEKLKERKLHAKAVWVADMLDAEVMED
jgi:hypothetical protein